MLVAMAARIREAITIKMTSITRAELRRQIDGSCARKAPQYDSVTGTSSSIEGARLQSEAGISNISESVAGTLNFAPSSYRPDSRSESSHADSEC